MGQAKVGTLLVLRGKSLRGVFSERDVIRRVYAAGVDVKTTPIDAVMTSKVSTVRRHEDSLRCLALLRKYKCRSLPVIKWWNTALGVVSIIDVLMDLTTALQAEKDEYERMATAETQLHFAPYPKQNLLRDLVRQQQLKTLRPQQSAREAVDMMAQFNIGSILVMEQGQLAGIISERDVLFKIAARGHVPNQVRLADIMTQTVTCIDASTSNAECLATMKRIGCRHLPVSENGDIVGVVSILNCLQWMFDEFNYYLDHWRTLMMMNAGPVS